MILVSYILLKNIKEHSENTSEKKKIMPHIYTDMDLVMC